MGASARRVRLLVVDDELHVRSSLAAWLRDEGYQVGAVADGRAALAYVEEHGAEIVLVDIRLPLMDGLELQRRLGELAPDATVIVITAFATVETAVLALKQGAYDYLVKPFEPAELCRIVAKAAERYELIAENRRLRARLDEGAPPLVLGEGGPMQRVLEEVEQVAASEASVLIHGESGTGKELIAGLVHRRSPRQAHPLVVVNCGALAEGVLESELFGHEKGAFTGALARRRGKIELADHGTLFLDEIGDIPPKVQIDLLRVVQERALTRVGGRVTIPVDFRLITATHRSLEEEVAAGRFRSDLYFRINVFTIELPPLRERPGDIPPLAEHFRMLFSRQMSRRIVGFTREALGLLCAHEWPGNVRELQNVVERAVVLCRSATIGAEHLPFSKGSELPPDLSLAALEAKHIRSVLAACAFNITQTAKLLGIDRVTLYAKMSKYGITRPST